MYKESINCKIKFVFGLGPISIFNYVKPLLIAHLEHYTDHHSIFKVHTFREVAKIE